MIAAPYLAATVVLGIAGAVKVARPFEVANALRTAGLPSHRLLVRFGAGAEAAVAVVALARPGALTGALVAGWYLAFAGFIALALRRGWPISSCGCFGRPDTAPSPAHLLLNIAAAGCAVWWAAQAPPSLRAVFVHQPWEGFPLALTALAVSYLAYLVFTNPLSAQRAAARTHGAGPR